jgi:hypothetical protein
MNLIQVFGPADALRGLFELEDAHFVRGTMTEHAPDRWELGGYASDAALDGIRSRGLEVVVVEPSAERIARLEEVRKAAEREAPT